MDKGLKTKSDEQACYSTLLPDVEYCPMCGRPVFYRIEVNGLLFIVHGDKSHCATLGGGS